MRRDRKEAEGRGQALRAAELVESGGWQRVASGAESPQT